MHLRTARRILVFLALGAASTVAVSWVLTLDVHDSRVPMQFAEADTAADGSYLSVTRRDFFGAIALDAALPEQRLEGIPMDQMVNLDVAVPAWARAELLDWVRQEPKSLPQCTRAMLITGWPISSMWCSFDQQPSPGYWWFKARNGIVLGPQPANPNPFAPLSPRERTLPTHIVWPGFAADTLLWACAWACAFMAPPALRRWIRRKRGQCERCGYNRRALDGIEACPECGARG